MSRAPACSKLTVDREPPDEANLSEDERQEIVQFADRTHNRRRAPKLQVISKPGKPLVIDFGPLVETTRLMSTFGTSEIDHADRMLNGIVNTALHTAAGSERGRRSSRPSVSSREREQF